MKLTRKKLFITGALLLTMCSGSYAAAVPNTTWNNNNGADNDSAGSITIIQQNQGQENAPANIEPVIEPIHEISNAKIDDLFNQILSSRNSGITPDRNGLSSPTNQFFYGVPRYGMSFFGASSASSYTPLESTPVAQDYRIGVGDEMTLSIWGIPEEGNFKFTVDRDGMAILPRVGAIRLAGYTFGEAERILRARLNQYYTGYQMNLSMGRLSSILVYVTGNARRPGAYTISSFSTLVNALIASGGPSENGTLRQIELRRQGRLIAVFDMYAMLMRGDKSQDMRLQAGDVIHIPNVGPLIGLAGEIRKPGVYELNGATRVQDLLLAAGGLNTRTFQGRVQFFRIYRNSYTSVFEGKLSEIENTELHDGDILRLFPVYNFSSTVDITGPVMRPGRFAIVPGRTTISEIIEHAGGLRPIASDKAEVVRVTPSLEGPVNEHFNINVAQALMGDPANNITLERDDQITVLIIPDWKKQIRVSITGEVRRPGSYAMFPGDKLSDLIVKAGGFTQRAFLRGAIFTRRSVANEQRTALNRMADQMERDLLQAMQNSAVSTSSAGETTAMNAEYQRRRALINSLRDLDIMGRVITKLDTAKNILDTEWDYELLDGDALRVPQIPLSVNVMGAVYSSNTQVYNTHKGINAYINDAGGALKNAHKRMLYLLKSDGTSVKLTRSTAMLSSKEWRGPHGAVVKIEPGDTIVVPVKYLDRNSIESFKDTVDIVYKVAIATGTIINVTKD